MWVVPSAMAYGNHANMLWNPQHRFMQFAGAARALQLTTLRKSPWKYNRKYITLYYLNKISHSYELVLGCCVIPLSVLLPFLLPSYSTDMLLISSIDDMGNKNVEVVLNMFQMDTATQYQTRLGLH